MDGAGNVYVTGLFEPPLDFGGGPVTGQASDIFLASYTNGGAHRWSVGLGSTALDIGLDLLAGGQGLY